MALIVVAQGVVRLPVYQPSAPTAAAVAAAPVASDQVAQAIDDLAAWPMASRP